MQRTKVLTDNIIGGLQPRKRNDYVQDGGVTFPLKLFLGKRGVHTWKVVRSVDNRMRTVSFGKSNQFTVADARVIGRDIYNGLGEGLTNDEAKERALRGRADRPTTLREAIDTILADLQDERRRKKGARFAKLHDHQSQRNLLEDCARHLGEDRLFVEIRRSDYQLMADRMTAGWCSRTGQPNGRPTKQKAARALHTLGWLWKRCQDKEDRQGRPFIPKGFPFPGPQPKRRKADQRAVPPVLTKEELGALASAIEAEAKPARLQDVIHTVVAAHNGPMHTDEIKLATGLTRPQVREHASLACNAGLLERVERSVYTAGQSVPTVTLTRLRTHVFLSMAFHTGVRTIDIRLLRWDDVNLDNGELCFESVKNGMTHRSFLQPDQLKSLRQLHAFVRGDASDYIFADGDGTGMHPGKSAFTSAYRRVVKRAGLSRRLRGHALHFFRANYATRLALKGYNRWQLCKAMGWLKADSADFYIGVAETILRTAPADFANEVREARGLETNVQAQSELEELISQMGAEQILDLLRTKRDLALVG